LVYPWLPFFFPVSLNSSSKANLTKADLSGADIHSVNFSDANLNKADFRKVKNINIIQIKQAQNWHLAIYDREIELLLKTEQPAITKK
jgi:Pentapeptide repeats (8 copies)